MYLLLFCYCVCASQQLVGVKYMYAYVMWVCVCVWVRHLVCVCKGFSESLITRIKIVCALIKWKSSSNAPLCDIDSQWVREWVWVGHSFCVIQKERDRERERLEHVLITLSRSDRSRVATVFFYMLLLHDLFAKCWIFFYTLGTA